jgi:glycosyltransferase involved in cell wall biosynthesis
VTTIVIPAHNEGQVIGRLLGRLGAEYPAAGHTVIVVANGCSDNTVEVARSFGPGVKVVSIPQASKHLALMAGDREARDFPRIYVDADVELGQADVRALEAELAQPGVLAAAPERVLVFDGCPWGVRWYYDIWLRLPQVREGLFARGVIAVSEEGHGRLAALPPLMADDLAASLSFGPAERRIAAGARAVCHAPKRTGDLLRRRIRAVTSVSQIERTEHAPPSSARTSAADLLAIVRRDPAATPRLALFAAVTIAARLAARRAIARGDYSTWLRDNSSRGDSSRGVGATRPGSQAT